MNPLVLKPYWRWFLVGVLIVGAQVNIKAQEARAARQNSTRSERTAALIRDGAAALDKGDLDTARILFKRALTISPQSVEAHTYLGVLADRADDVATAQRHFAAAAIAAPASAAVLNNYGAVLMRLGQFEKASMQFQASLRLNENQPSALVNLAQIRFAGGTPESLQAARELFARAHKLAPDLEIARALVVVALRLKDQDAAELYFSDYRKALPGSSSGNNTPAARAELGRALLEAGLTSEAIEELNAAHAAERQKIEYVLLLARAYMARQDLPSAGRALEGSVARGVENAAIYAALAEVYERSGRPENAIPAMRLAIERNPKNEAYRWRYGMLLTDTKAPAAAVIRLEESLKEFPKSSRIWFALGIAHFTDHKSEKAIQALEKALAIDPKFAPALAYLGLIHREQGRSVEAVECYDRALAIDKKLPVVHYLAADALLRETTPDSKKVEAHLRRAIELDPSFAAPVLALGKLYVRENRLDEAINFLERAVALQPNQAEPHYQLGRLYVRFKRQTEGQVELAKFQQLSESQKEQEQNERRDIVRRLATVRF